MKTYLVGGAVRDKLLRLPIKERDWVVVGGDVSDMLQLGFRQVGKEFPVFLHPRTGEEYALARKERKTKPGYQGFSFDTSPNVTLEDDLMRRDLTINAMAETREGQLIDPFHGQKDLQNRILRHVSAAFSEDPVRILRIARFCARFHHFGFQVHPDTLSLMRKMVASGEVDALVAERVWKELERALTESNPEQFFEVLDQCGALAKLFPHLSFNSPGIKALIKASQISSDPQVRFASLLFDYQDPDLDNLKKSIQDLCKRYRIPNQFRLLAQLTASFYQTAHRAKHLSPEALLKLLTNLDAFRRTDRFNKFIVATSAITESKNQTFDTKYLHQVLHIAQSIDIQSLIKQGYKGEVLAEKIKNKRLEALEKR